MIVIVARLNLSVGAFLLSIALVVMFVDTFTFEVVCFIGYLPVGLVLHTGCCVSCHLVYLVWGYVGLGLCVVCLFVC